jgi:hypothetical protein
MYSRRRKIRRNVKYVPHVDEEDTRMGNEFARQHGPLVKHTRSTYG